MAWNGSNSLADALLDAARSWFEYPPGENRATGYLLVAFQAYRDGNAVTGWHTDDMPQTIVSLGATRAFGLGDETLILRHGDVVSIPAGVPHCVLSDPYVEDERISLVFRGALT